MSAASRLLKVGDMVTTDYASRGKFGAPRARATHHITERRTGQSQSGVLFRVEPPLRTWRDTSNPHEEYPPWYDADWFEPANLGAEPPQGAEEMQR